MSALTSLRYALAGICLSAIACSSDPVFTDEGGTGASGGDDTGSGASKQGGAGVGADGSGAGSTGGSTNTGGSTGTGGSTNTGGSTGTGGQGGSPAPTCGDGFIDANDGEECDDGNPNDQDGCSGCIVDCPIDAFKDPATNHCYFVAEGFHGEFQDAEDACKNTAPGTTLAALSTSAEFNLVIGEVGDDDQWIGGNDLDVENAFEWTNGEPWNFVDGDFPWAATQPNDETKPEEQDCVGLGTYTGSLRMYDRECIDSFDALCERVPIGQ